MKAYSIRTVPWQQDGGDGGALRLVREEVFIREQGVPIELEWDEIDACCIHLLALDAEGNPIATARLSPDGVVGRMAVLREWRGKGVGGRLLSRLLEEARKKHFQHVYLSAQLHATGFYAKYGFRAMGKDFMEAGIPHIKMALRLSR
jgi:predicted GNAT family N-acyltransferase